MKKFKLLLMLSFAALVLTNCFIDDDEEVITPPTSSGFKSLKDAALSSLIQKKTFKAEDGIDFTSTNGVKLEINSGCLYKEDFSQLSGNIELEFVEIFDRGNMLVTNKPLMGKDDLGNLKPLITGGEFYVNVTQNGTQVKFCGYNLTVPGSLTGGIKDGMILWGGSINSDGDIVWDRENAGNKEGGAWNDGEGNNYSVFCSEFGWTNIDVLMSEPDPKTPIAVKVPEGYNKTNASVYVAYKGQPGVLALLDVYVPTQKLFTEHYGWGPVGMNLYVIFVSESAGQYIYSIKDVKLELSKAIVFETSDLKTIAKDELVSIINKLN